MVKLVHSPCINKNDDDKPKDGALLRKPKAHGELGPGDHPLVEPAVKKDATPEGDQRPSREENKNQT
jgi:hypothetical protein